MAELNQYTAIGRATADTEIKDVNDTHVAKVRLAINQTFFHNGEKKTKVCYIDGELWGKRAPVLHKYVKKGKELLIIGELVTDSWEAQDGGKRSKIKVSIQDFQFLGAPKTSDDNSQDGNSNNTPF